MLKDVPNDPLKPDTENSPPENVLHDARNLINILLLTWKNYSIYPEGHTAVTKTLEKLKAAFDHFLEQHNSLRFIVKKNQLLNGSTVLYELSPGATSEDLVSILFRDGIQWLEFLPGLQLEELIYFFQS